MRIEGDVLLDALQSAPTVLSAIDRSNKAPWPGHRWKSHRCGGRSGLGAGVSVEGRRWS
jgi:hypothetical protein